MGFDYGVYVATEKPITDDEEEQIFEAYRELRYRCGFPPLDEMDNTSLSHGTGDVEGICEEFLLLSSRFPNIKFIVYYLYAGFSELDIIEFEGNEYKNILHKTADHDLVVPGGKVPVVFSEPEVKNMVRFRWA